MFIPQNHPKSQQRVRTCAVKEKPVFRASLALSMLEIELYQISLPYDRGRSGYEITVYLPGVFNETDVALSDYGADISTLKCVYWNI